ncbi:MAG: prepilin-type N-terminal cleavage/methylation domain-containing protein [Betaproteobacteria bacterium]|nr:MAG: prepilin-type N-terminal cleavage/methylation domain-containing protein [Betaproteobacteria bacterium]
MSSKGFSLVELAVALAIIALLLAGALIPLSTQIDVRNSAEAPSSGTPTTTVATLCSA